ncbi:MAG: hypothetical protein HKN77_09635, partial [Woeseiaceae bacterium]|nr:hypothetical protein [Woeseiaceae bacterium]
MNKLFRTVPFVTALLATSALSILPSVSMAEGSAQFGLTQRLVDNQASLAPTGTGDPVYGIDANSASQFVDIVTSGEVINISLCGAINDDDIAVQIFNPSGTQVYTNSATSGNVLCTDPMTGPLTNPFRYTTATTGAHRIVLQNTSRSAYGDSYFERWDISVTADTGTNPNPAVAAGRLYGYSWNMNAPTFAETASTDANLYALVPGGRPNTNYIWQLDLTNMAGRGYNIIANAVGVNTPNSGFSTPLTGNSAVYKYPVYLGVPAVANPQPSLSPVITGARFIDNANEDNGISPGFTPGVQDSGNFEFTSDVAGTYALFVDVNQNNIFGDPGDVFLLGLATVGANTVPWNGRDPNDNILPVDTYNARVSVRLGEYHFVANDIETSGGGVDNGLTIFQSDLAGALSNTLIYWDDVTILGAGAGGTSNRPLGETSGTAAGRHTWGNFTTTGFGNERLIDTYVYGLSTIASVAVAITADDTNTLIGADGSISSTPYILRNGSVSVSVTDADLNTSPTVVEQIVVSLLNDATGETETVTLTETGVNTGVFSGTLPTTFGTTAGSSNSGNMIAQEGDTITATYEDYQTSTGSQQTRTSVTTVAFDTDGDNVFDPVDLDDDNDGIPDTTEPAGDLDGDGLVNSRDIDADGDGIPDNIEAQPEGNFRAPLGTDTDGDGLDDRYDATNGGVAISITNTDGTGLPDYVDTDADDDGVLDAIEGHDANLNGIADRTPANADTDGDGLDDAYDTVVAPASGNAIGSNADLQNADGDSNRDWRDTNDDNDTLSTFNEDTNNNGNRADDDDDGDLRPNYLESSTADADGDGTSDQADPNDADPCIPSAFGTGCTTDTDGDGTPDSVEGPTADSDGDGTPDYLESSITDTDGDGVNDQADPANNDPCIPSAFGNGCTTDTDGDGTPDSVEGPTADDDGDGTPNYLESSIADTDGDGTNDQADPANTDPCIPSAFGNGCTT